MKIVLTSISFILFFNFTIAQKILNPSFEGIPEMAKCPPFWFSFGQKSTPDTQPGIFNVSNPSTEGKTYVSMVSRDDRTYETMYQNLNTVLKKGKCYLFSIDIALSSNFIIRGFSTIDYTNPSILGIWGTDSNLVKPKLLPGEFEQLIIEDDSIFKIVPSTDFNKWKTYYFVLSPKSVDYNRIYLAALPNGYEFSHVLIDNIKEIELPTSGNLDTLLCKDALLNVDRLLPNHTYLWNDGSKDSIKTIEKAGNYILKRSGICKAIDTIKVSYSIKPETPIIQLNNNLITSNIIDNSYKFNWFYNGNLLGNNKTELLAYNKGNYQLKIIDTTSGCEKKSNSINIEGDDLTIINNEDQKSVFLSYSGLETGNVSIKIIDAAGKEFLGTNTLKNDINFRYTLKPNYLANGIYIIYFQVSNKIIAKRIRIAY
ncbi:MAG: hypothetical protein ACEQSR_10095 [Candidatus Methylacidiphilales bacterium]